jgi:hypothetical protein
MIRLTARPIHDALVRSVAVIGLVTTCSLPAFAADVADGESLADQKAWVMAHAGRAVVGANGLSLTFHPATNSVWLEENGEVIEFGSMVVTAPDAPLAILWHSGETTPLPLILPTTDQISASVNELASHYDRILASPLTEAAGPLPKGTVFDATGVLRLPDGSGLTPQGGNAAAAAQAASPTIGLWYPRGAFLEIIIGEIEATLAVADLVTTPPPD